MYICRMNTSNIIGRREEIRRLQKCYESNKAQLVIVYGRRRVGKTYLVSELFRGRFALRLTGAYDQPKEVQLAHFADDLRCVYQPDLPYPPRGMRLSPCYGRLWKVVQLMSGNSFLSTKYHGWILQSRTSSPLLNISGIVSVLSSPT